MKYCNTNREKISRKFRSAAQSLVRLHLFKRIFTTYRNPAGKNREIAVRIVVDFDKL